MFPLRVVKLQEQPADLFANVMPTCAQQAASIEGLLKEFLPKQVQQHAALKALDDEQQRSTHLEEAPKHKVRRLLS